MNTRRKNLSAVCTSLLLCGLSLAGCTEDDARLSPAEIAGAVEVEENPHGNTLLGGGLEFGIIPFHEKNECSVLGFTDTDVYPSHLEIPGKLLFGNKIYTVTELDDRCFNARKNLLSVVIPEGVVLIGYASFMYCNSLMMVTLPKTLKTIEGDVFYECNSLKKIDLPEGLESIGSEAFTSCYKLEEISLPSTLKEIGEYCLTNCYLSKLVCLATNPPKFVYRDTDYHYPDFLRIDSTPIYVPKESLQTYLDSEWGQTYPNQIYPL